MLGVGVFVAYNSQKSRADLLELKSEILALVGAKYVTDATFQQYTDSHDRSILQYRDAHAREHVEIQKFITRHQDWKHATEPWIRAIDMNIADLKIFVDKWLKDRLGP